MLAAVTAALAFSAPPSLTRRDMVQFGLGATAAAVFQAPAFAEEAKEPPKVAAEVKKEEEKSTLTTPSSYYNPNGNNVMALKGSDGVNMRKASDPNACSEVCMYRTPIADEVLSMCGVAGASADTPDVSTHRFLRRARRSVSQSTATK